MRDNDRLEPPEIVGSWFAQARGYLATIDAYVSLGKLKDPRLFVTKKLAAPVEPRAVPPGSEMLDTLAECSWGLWLHEQFGNLEEARVLPSEDRDADFFVTTKDGPLWVDCISIAPTKDRADLNCYFSRVVQNKWHEKFGLERDREIRAAIAVSVLKNQEFVVSFLRFDEASGKAWEPRESLWSACPTLERAWFGMPPWHDRPQQPNIFATWKRP